MAAYSTGASWAFPDDLPGVWKKDEEEDDIQQQTDINQEPDDGYSSTRPETNRDSSIPQDSGTRTHSRRHYPPRECRICLEVVLPTFHTDESTPSLSAAFHRTREPRVSYESPDSGRLLRPCKCKGSQKYVHEGCLSAWRLQDPLKKRNYWQCPTCRYRYRLQRLEWSRWIGSTLSQVGLTVLIFVLAMFALGFIADPIINLYLDPVHTITSGGGPTGSLIYDDEAPSWMEHFVKGLATLGLLGFAKLFLTLGPWNWFNIRGGVSLGSGGRTTGRDRLTQLSWVAILFGVATFLYAVWKGVRAWCRRTLEQAGERVMDVPGSADDDDDTDDERHSS